MTEYISSDTSKEKSPQREARKYLLGLFTLSLWVDKAYTKGRVERIDATMSRKLHRDYAPHPKASDDPYIEQYAAMYPRVELWHGTGRYQYQGDKKVDVLASICKQEKLSPALDEFDVMSGSMESTSLARSRMYARAYADIHGRGVREPNRYGSAGFWGAYVGGRIPLDTAIESKVWHKKSRDSIRSAMRNRTGPPWGAKVHAGFVRDEHGQAMHKGIFTPFFTGSDIKDNYPVLFGVKDVPTETPIAKSIARHEVRTSDELPFSALTHIEVPFEHVQKTEGLLERYGLEMPVLAIESGEEYCSTLPFSKLVYPNGSTDTSEKL